MTKTEPSDLDDANNDRGNEPGGETSRQANRRSPAAQRALAEAEARRRLADAATSARPKEVNGRGGEEPVRYGDWEVKGLATDF